MLHVLWIILKIIGFVILLVVGILLGFTLLVLFVPIRYHADGAYDQRMRGRLHITWLLHMLSVAIAYEEDLQIAIKVLGYQLFPKLKPAHRSDPAPEESELLQTQELHEEDSKEDPKEYSKEYPKVAPNVSPDSPKRSVTVSDTVPKPQTILEKIKFLFQQVCDKLNHRKESWERLFGFLLNKENQDTLRLILRQIKALLCHILPRKVSGKVRFGFDDPYTTGLVLEALSVFYAWYGQGIQVIPIFDEEIFAGELRLCGRIRLVSLLYLGIRILINKNFRILLKRWSSEGGIFDG
ncbi:MAG: DUF2953 domain-containing protein [Hungatella sp.]